MGELNRPGEQICRKTCLFCIYVDKDENPNLALLEKEFGLPYAQGERIAKQDGGVIGFCRLSPFGTFVVLGIPCQVPDLYRAAIAQIDLKVEGYIH